MDTVLIVQQYNNIDEKLLRSAKNHVKGTNKEILICVFIDKDRIKRDLQRQVQPDRTLEEIKQSAEKEAKKVAEDAFGEDVPYTILESIGNTSEDIIQIAEEQNCEHIFVNGRRRSPTGKAIFGDIAQSTILDFNGPVTVTTTK